MVGGYIYVNVNVINANYNLELIFLFQISEHKKNTRDESMHTWFSFCIFLFITYHLLAWFKYARVQKKYCESTHQTPANLSMEFSNVEMESNVLIANLSLLVYLPCGKAPYESAHPNWQKHLCHVGWSLSWKGSRALQTEKGIGEPFQCSGAAPSGLVLAWSILSLSLSLSFLYI